MLKINSRVRGLIFDCDGTIVDTMPLHYRAWVEALREYRYEFPERMFYEMAGIPTVRILEMFNEKDPCNLPVQLIAGNKESLFEALLDEALPIEPVVEIIRHYSGSLPMAVATGATRDICTKVLRSLGLIQHFQAIVTSEDVQHAKPAPDIYLEAARLINVPPASCVAFEDADLGLQAARAAGMLAIDVRPMCDK